MLRNMENTARVQQTVDDVVSPCSLPPPLLLLWFYFSHSLICLDPPCKPTSLI